MESSANRLYVDCYWHTCLFVIFLFLSLTLFLFNFYLIVCVYLVYDFHYKQNKLSAWRHDMPRSSPRALPSRRNVAVVSHAYYVLTVTAAPASRIKAAMNKAAW